MSKYPEIFIGLVAPIGSNRKNIKKYLEEAFEKFQYNYHYIKITDILFHDNAFANIPKSYKCYLKMELCNEIRKGYGNGFLAALVVDYIRKLRKNTKNQNINKGSVYIIDQIKNLGEYHLLSNIYDTNYIQISCSSNKLKRNAYLENSFDQDIDHMKFDLTSSKIFKKAELNEFIKSGLNKYLKLYKQQILPDASHNLIGKDFNETHAISSEDKSHGQQISSIFHESHYFINLDTPEDKLREQTTKFVELLFGRHQGYPTQDEFGMSLAHTAAVRSNFPGDRQIGSCIISEFGEVLSIGSIRAPTSHSNPDKAAEIAVTSGYINFKEQIDKWTKALKVGKKHNREFEGLRLFLNSTIDFHPCTHAELAAICDAVKIGISIRNATLYTTTFPCHICAKDIVSSGISKVVFCEAYPKSKNEKLYSEVIEIDPEIFNSERVPFCTFAGVGPKRYNYVYDLKSKIMDTKETQFVPPLLKYRTRKNYQQIEIDVANFVSKSDNIMLDKHPFVIKTLLVKRS